MKGYVRASASVDKRDTDNAHQASVDLSRTANRLHRFCMTAMVSGIALLSSAAVCGQSYPNKPVRIITAEPGGGTDFVARLIALGISPLLGQQVVVDNRVGMLATIAAARATPDGYTLLINGPTIWNDPLLRSDAPYDTIRDFAPVILATSTPNVLVIYPGLPVNSARELIAQAKAKPGALNFATSGTGFSNHLAGELFKSMTGINVVRVNYKGTAAATNDTISGATQFMFGNAGSVMPQSKAGRLRALAVTSLQPSALAPGLPTLAATVPGFESISPYGIYAPANTPPAAIKRIGEVAAQALAMPDIKEKFFNGGMEVVSGSAEQLGALMKSETAKWGKIIKDANIRAE